MEPEVIWYWWDYEVCENRPLDRLEMSQWDENSKVLRLSGLGFFFLMHKNEASSQISHRTALGCRYTIMLCCEDDDSAVPFLSLAEEGGVILGSIWLPLVHSVSQSIWYLHCQ